MRVKDKETKLNTSEIDKVTATTRPPMNKRKNSTATKSRVLIHANDGNEIELPCGSEQVGNWLRDRIIADLHLRV